MIHIFRLYDNNRCDFLDFDGEDVLVDTFMQERNPLQYDWQTVPIKMALKDEESMVEHQALQKMEKRGDTTVIRVTTNGKGTWYSPSAVYDKGIPTLYRVALSYFTDPAKEHRITSHHHEIFDILKDERFSSLSKKLFFNILKRVKASKCDRRLDLYVDYNLGKLKNYGVTMQQIEGTYVEIKDMVENTEISCPYYSEFLYQLLDVCIKKEKELVGENRVYVKAF